MGADGFYQLPVDAEGKQIACSIDSRGYTQYIKELKYPSFRFWTYITNTTANAVAVLLFNNSTEYNVIIDSFVIFPEVVRVGTLAQCKHIIQRCTGYTGGTARTIIAKDTADSLPANILAFKDITTATYDINIGVDQAIREGESGADTGANYTNPHNRNILNGYPGAKNWVLRTGYGICAIQQYDDSSGVTLYYIMDFHVELVP